MRNAQLIPVVVVVTIFLFSCENRYRRTNTFSKSSSPTVDVRTEAAASKNQIIGKAGEAYQVTTDEYEDYFNSRYGLLYKKHSNQPFTGRIVSIDQSGATEFVSSDESWSEGRKNGVSTKWFSNGVKMYERNYKMGKWNGTVTRWWPNGQKMYVRAYTDGKRHGKEATWRSDGTQIDLSVPEKIPSVGKPATSDMQALTDGQDVPASSTESVQPTPTFFEPSAPMQPNEIVPLAGEDLPALPSSDLSVPETEVFSAPIDSPIFPPMESEPVPEFASPIDSGALPPLDEMPSTFPDAEGLPPLPGMDPVPATSPTDLPSFTEAPDEELPPLPGMSDPMSDDLPDLPGFPEPADGTLPPLPGMSAEPSDGLPPLPQDDAFDGLPPLPEFPE